jgi:type IV pilus assembly protein PilM
MFGKKNIFIGLDVGSYSVKAVAIQPNKGRMTLVGYSQQRIGEQDVSVVIRRVIDQLGLKPSNLVTSVSGRSVIVRQVETPRLPDAELKSHITIGADQYIPFGLDEVVIDFQPLEDEEGQEGNANMNVQLVAVRRGFIEDHVGLLNNAGIHPKAIDVDLFALCNAYEVFGPTNSAEENPAIALVDIGASKVCVAILKGSRPLFTREFYLAGNEITDAIARQFAEKPEEIEELKLNPGDSLQPLLDAAMPALEDLANEIRLSFDYVEGQFDENVQTIVLSGGSSQLATIGDILGNLLGRSICVFDGLAGLDLDPKRYDIQSLESNAPSLTVALGLAVHLAGDATRGLGGHQLTGWQSGRGGGVPVTPAAEAPAQDSAPAEPSPAAAAPTVSAPPPPPPPSEPMAMPEPEAAMAPPPISAPPPAAAPLDFPSPDAPLDMPPAPAPEVAAAPPVIEIPVAEPSGGNAAILPADSAAENLDQMFGADDGEQQASDYGHQSSMLVILEDDDDTNSQMAPPPPAPPATNDDGGLPPLDPP